MQDSLQSMDIDSLLYDALADSPIVEEVKGGMERLSSTENLENNDIQLCSLESCDYQSLCSSMKSLSTTEISTILLGLAEDQIEQNVRNISFGKLGIEPSCLSYFTNNTFFFLHLILVFEYFLVSPNTPIS